MPPLKVHTIKCGPVFSTILLQNGLPGRPCISRYVPCPEGKAMSLADILFIYFTLGAPFAVYQYFHYRGVQPGRRLVTSILSFLFWLPAVTVSGVRRFINALSATVFVSGRNLDAPQRRLAEIQRDISTQLVSGSGAVRRDRCAIREILERYVGLMTLTDRGPSDTDLRFSDLFIAAGRTDTTLAAACLKRRNLKTLDRHRIKARRDFVTLFEDVSLSSVPAAGAALESAVELARELDDTKAISALELIAAQARDELWNPHHRQLPTAETSTQATPLTMTASSLSSD